MTHATLRKTLFASGLIACSLMVACTPYRSSHSSYNTAPYPTSRHAPAPQAQGVEYGRVTQIEVLQGRARGQTSGGGAILGAVVGGLIGNQFGKGSGRAAATGVGVIGGAVVGNAIEGNNQGQGQADGYRISVQLDYGGYRVFDVPHPGDLREGDRVMLNNGQISRY
jgi:outer membrane lipoprotein SlyB